MTTAKLKPIEEKTQLLTLLLKIYKTANRFKTCFLTATILRMKTMMKLKTGYEDDDFVFVEDD